MVNIQIPKEAIEYLAFNASLEPDYAEELLQTVLGMCKFEAAQHHAHLTPGSSPVFCVCCGGEVTHPVCTGCLPSPAQVA